MKHRVSVLNLMLYNIHTNRLAQISEDLKCYCREQWLVMH